MENKDNKKIITVDFTDYPEEFTWIMTNAKSDLRTPEMVK